MEVIDGLIHGLGLLLAGTWVALWKTLTQAATFFQFLFTGSSSWPLMGALTCLLLAGILTHARDRRGLRRARGAPVPWNRGYWINLGLILGAFAGSLAGLYRVHSTSQSGVAEALAAQNPVYWIVLVVTGLHLFWFIVDIGSAVFGSVRGRSLCSRIAANKTPYYMLLPTFITLGLFLYLPAFSIFYHSFFAYDFGTDKLFIGLENYHRLLQDGIFWKSMKNMVIFNLLGITFSLIVPLLVAELIFHLQSERSRYYMRAVFLIPMVVPGVVTASIWLYLYSDTGLFALLGRTIGLGDSLEGLLSRPQTALYAVIFVGFPFVHGINLLIFYAGLSNVDEAVWEAARMDGANPLKRFFLIDIPLLARQFKLLLILGIIHGIQAFESVLVMTMGGPGWETMLPGLYMYRSAITFNEFGYGSAIGVILFLLVLALSLAVNRGLPNTRT